MVTGSLFLSALLLYLSFPNVFLPTGYWSAAWVFAPPFFYALERTSRAGRALCGMAFGLVFYACLVVWFIPYSLPGYFLFVGLLTVQPVIFACLYLREEDFSRRWIHALYVPAAWVLSEYLRSRLMQGWSWNLAHSQTFAVPLLQSVDLFGSWGLSFAIVFVNGRVFRLLTGKGNRRNNIVVIAAVFILLGGYGAWVLQNLPSETAGPRLKVAALQPRIDYRMKLDAANARIIFEKHMALAQQALAQATMDVMIWPETAVLDDVQRIPEFRNRLAELARKNRVVLIVGSALSSADGETRFNGAVVFGPDGEITDVYHKRYLVPLTEYLPKGAAWDIVGGLFSVEDFGFSAGRETGLGKFAGKDGKAVRAGLAICSEDTIGEVFREFVHQDAGFAVVLLNDGWFDSSAGLILHGQNSLMHAAEYKIPVVRAANTGWTTAVDPFGRGNPRPEKKFLDEEGWFVWEIRPLHRRTPASIIGDSFCGVCAVFVIMGLFLRVKKKEMM